ncbi:MAG: kelch repeat-containing protein, partial [Xanthomonadales bacterium]|nr:kelch repeat-containing protein [Xanthomonadales bacterium]
SWTQGAPMIEPRARGASCVVAGRIYLFGGTAVSGGVGTDSTLEYDPATDSWRTRAAMPTLRVAATASEIDGRCHVIAGSPSNDSRRPLSAHEIYDPVSNSWSSAAPLPTARFAHAAAVLDGELHVIAGTTDGATILDSVEVYEPSGDAWRSGLSVGIPRAAHLAETVNGKIYIAGGTNNALVQTHASVEVFDPLSNSWSALAPMPTGRWEVASAVVSGQIYAVGGASNASARSDMEAYRPASDNWVERTSMPAPRFRLMAEAVGGKIYVFGGFTPVQPGRPVSGEVHVYTPPAGGPVFSINAGLNDAWFNPSTAGQGFFITVFEEIGALFLAWFTYDTERPPNDVTANLGEPGHRWLTAFGPYSGNLAELDIELTSGGIFDSPQPQPDQSVDGTISIEFHDCNAATVAYDIFSAGVTGTIEIERIALDNVGLCE